MSILNTNNNTLHDDFRMCEDNLPMLKEHPQRLRNTFIMHCLSGQANITRDMETFVFEQNMELTLLPDCTIRIQHKTTDFRVRYCICSQSLFDEITHKMPSRFIDFLADARPFKMSVPRDFEANRLYFGMLQLADNDTGNIHRRQIAANTIQNFFLDIHDKEYNRLANTESKNSGPAEMLVRKFWKLVTKHCQQHRDVQWYATQLCISTRHLSQVFRQVSNTTPKQAIDEYIALEIKIELQSTHDSIQQIADRLNFSDQSAMGRFFRRMTGISPSAYRLEM